MNLVLLDPPELDPGSVVTLSDHRARHLLEVLRVRPGDEVRLGVVDGAQGHGDVLSVGAGTVTLRCRWDAPTLPPGRDTLLLAMPRPKVLARCIEHATALGFGRIVLFRSRRVEKSHLSSRALEAAHIDERVRRGLEQSRRTHRPEVHVVLRFRELVEERLDALVPSGNRFVADAEAPHEAALARVSPEPIRLVIGPEGGLIDHELEQFAKHGFELVRAGRQPLRVETALSYSSGQLRAAQLRGSSR